MFDFLRKDKKDEIKMNPKNQKELNKLIKTNNAKINNFLTKYERYTNDEILNLNGEEKAEIFKKLTLPENCLTFTDIELKNTFYFCLKSEMIDIVKLKYGLSNSDTLEFVNYLLTSLIVSIYQNNEPALMFLNALNIANVDRIMQHYANLRMT